MEGKCTAATVGAERERARERVRRSVVRVLRCTMAGLSSGAVQPQSVSAVFDRSLHLHGGLLQSQSQSQSQSPVCPLVGPSESSALSSRPRGRVQGLHREQNRMRAGRQAAAARR
jgi:hypothetical protein